MSTPISDRCSKCGRPENPQQLAAHPQRVCARCSAAASKSAASRPIPVARPLPVQEARSSAAGRSAGDPHIGQLGRFQLLAVLGQGAFGRVYRAHDPQVDRLVALKVPTFSAGDAELVKRFVSEARAAGQLRHPHIVPIYECGQADGQYYIATQLIAGQTLSARIRDQLADFLAAAQWTRDLASALAYAHERGIVHRDVKPENVMLDERGQVQIMDFGLAKRTDDQSQMTIDGSLLGTPAYMSPEQARGEHANVGPHSDQYSLGVVLYELLTGQRPFQGPPHSVIAQVLTVEPPPIAAHRPTAPADLIAICEKAMSKEAGARYASTSDLAQDLDRYLRGEPIVARPLSPPQRAWRWYLRNQRVSQLAGLALLILLIGTVVSTALYFQAARDRGLAQESAEAEKKSAHKAKEEEQRANRERSDAVTARNEAIYQSAELIFERALVYCEQGEVARGLLLLVAALEKAQQADAKPLEAAIRWNLATWLRELHRPLFMFKHPDSADTLAFSADGKLLATGCRDGFVRLWNVESGKPVGKPLPHPWPVHGLAFHPTQPILATGCDDGKVRLWSTDSWSQQGEDLLHYAPNDLPKLVWPSRTGVSCVAFSPDGSILAASGWNARIKFWDSQSRQPHKDCSEISAMAWSFVFTSNAEIALASPAATVAFHNIKTGQTTSEPIKTGSWMFNVSVNRQRTRAVASSLQAHEARRFDLKTREAIEPKYKHVGSVWHAEYSPDGDYVLSASNDCMARLWDDRTGLPNGPALLHATELRYCKFAPNGKTVATSSLDGEVRVWSLAEKTMLHEFAHTSWSRGAAFSPDNKLFVTTTVAGPERDGVKNLTVTVRDVSTPAAEKLRFSTNKWATNVCFSPDSSRIYVGDNQDQVIRAFDLKTGTEIGATSPMHGDEVWRIATSPNGHFLATGAAEYQESPKGRSARLWDATTFKPIGEPLAHQGRVFGLAFTPDSQWFITGSQDRTTRVWNATTGEPKGEPVKHPAGVWTVAVHPQGELVAVGTTDRTIRLYSFDDWQLQGAPMQHDGEIISLEFDATGELLLSGSIDSTARVWHVASQKPIGPAYRHTNAVNVATMSRDGKYLLTAGDDTKARLWKPPAKMSGSVVEIRREIERLSAMTIDKHNAPFALNAEEWSQRD